MRKLLARWLLGDTKSTQPKTESEVIADRLARDEACERSNEQLDLEWSKMYDQFRRLYAKIAKRAIDDAPEPEKGRQPRTAVEGHPTINPAALRLLGRS